MQLQSFTPLPIQAPSSFYSAFQSNTAKVYHVPEGQSTVASHVDQIAKAPFKEMLADRTEEPVTEVAKHFFHVVDRVTGWFNKTGWNGDILMGILSNINILDDANLDKLPIELPENDLSPLSECKNLFYTFNHPKLNATFNIRLSLNGSCRIFKLQEECMIHFNPIFAGSGILLPGVLRLREDDGVRNFTISMPSKFINSPWILEGEAHAKGFHKLYIDFLSDEFDRFGYCEQTKIDKINSDAYTKKVIIGLSGAFISTVFLGVIAKCFYNRVTCDRKQINDEIPLLPCPGNV